MRLKLGFEKISLVLGQDLLARLTDTTRSRVNISTRSKAASIGRTATGWRTVANHHCPSRFRSRKDSRLWWLILWEAQGPCHHQRFRNLTRRHGSASPRF
jgi:hypothetical protein